MERVPWNTIASMINLYRTNNTSQLTPEQISCMNLVRDIFIKADPVPVTAGKRFQTDEQLIEYYANLEKKYSTGAGHKTAAGAVGSIFDKSFVISPVMKAYADKFYKRRLGLASSHLSDVVRYQMADAITQNKPLPLVRGESTEEYLRLLHHKTEIAPNVQEGIDRGTDPKLAICSDVINGVVEDVLLGLHNGYYVNTTLYAPIRDLVHRFRDNVTYLLNTPLTLSTNVFGLLETRAVAGGQRENVDYSALASARKVNTPLEESLTNLAFENEALRRGIVQQLNVKYADLPK